MGSDWWLDWPNNCRSDPEGLPLVVPKFPVEWNGPDGNLKYEFENKWFLPHIEHWEKWLVPWFEARREAVGRPLKLLEVGCYEGQSTLWILERLCRGLDTLYCIDPWDFDRAVSWAAIHQRWIDNIAKCDSRESCRVMQSKSTDVLPRLPGSSVDFIYIDGDHNTDAVVADSVQALRIVDVGGLVVWDDYYCPAQEERESVRAGVDRVVQQFNLQLRKLGHHKVWIRRR